MTTREPASASITDLQRYGAALVDRVENGARILITRHGKPVAEMRPVVALRSYGLPVDERETFEALMDAVQQAIADARDFGRRHAMTPTTEENQ